MPVFEWLGSNLFDPSVITAFATIVLVCATIILAKHTKNLNISTEQMAKSTEKQTIFQIKKANIIAIKSIYDLQMFFYNFEQSFRREGDVNFKDCVRKIEQTYNEINSLSQNFTLNAHLCLLTKEHIKLIDEHSDSISLLSGVPFKVRRKADIDKCHKNIQNAPETTADVLQLIDTIRIDLTKFGHILMDEVRKEPPK